MSDAGQDARAAGAAARVARARRSRRSCRLVAGARGAAGRGAQAAGAWVVAPASGRPRGTVHFLGGAFAGAAPGVAYGLLLQLLAEAGYTCVATPYAVTFQHLACAAAVQQARALGSLRNAARGQARRCARGPAHRCAVGIGLGLGSGLS